MLFAAPGKCATANAMMNDKVFLSRACWKSVTMKCKHARTSRFGTGLLIVDTPGLFDNNSSKEDIDKEIKKCIAISSPGPHAFLLVISLNSRFTKEEAAVLDELDDMFGDDMMKFLIVVFTGRDQIEGGSIESHIEESPDKLRQILKTAQGGYVTFNNKGTQEEKKADSQALFDRIDQVVKQNNGEHFTSEMFKQAEEVMQARIAMEIEKKEADMRREIEQELRREMEETLRMEREIYQKLHEDNVGQMEKMKKELEQQREKLRSKPGDGQKSKDLVDIIKTEAETEAKKQKLVRKMQKVQGVERTRMHDQMANVGAQIAQIRARKSEKEQGVADGRLSTVLNKEAVLVRDKERNNVVAEDEEAMNRFTRGIKNMGTRFLNLFR